MNKIKILFPCSPFSNKEVDDNFQEEFKVTKTLGIDSFFYDHDLLANEKKVKVFGLKEDGLTILIRGWMMAIEQYEILYGFLKNNNQNLITTPEQYKNCHYLRNSYQYIGKYSPKTLFTEDFDQEILFKMFKEFPKGIILKDYVKSEKHIPGLFFIPPETTAEQLKNIIDRFIAARGKLFNIGVSFRDFISLKHYDGEVNEWRVFVFKNKIVSVSQNSNINPLANNFPKPPQKLIESISKELKHLSQFFTIDFAEKESGEWIVVETGDGQVSGLSPKQNSIGLFNSIVSCL